MKTLVGVIGALALASVPAFATHVACPPLTGSTYANPETLQNLNTGGGCSTIDQSFFNFSVAGSTHTQGNPAQNPIPGVPGLSDIFFTVQTAGTNPGDPFTIRLTSPADGVASTGNFENTGAGKGTVTSVVEFAMLGLGSPNGNWAPNQLVWTVGNVNIQGGASTSEVNGTLEICIGQTTFVGCTNLVTLTIEPVDTSDPPNTTRIVNTGVIIDPSSVLAIRQTLNFVKGNAGASNSVTVGYVDIGFGQIEVVPEPATFGLMGAALLGLALYRRKSKI